MVISFRLPRISLGAVSNLAGLLGLVAIAVAIGGLTGTWWWALLAGGIEAVGLAYLAGAQAQAAEQAPAAAAAASSRSASAGAS